MFINEKNGPPFPPQILPSTCIKSFFLRHLFLFRQQNDFFFFFCKISHTKFIGKLSFLQSRSPTNIYWWIKFIVLTQPLYSLSISFHVGLEGNNTQIDWFWYKHTGFYSSFTSDVNLLKAKFRPLFLLFWTTT